MLGPLEPPIALIDMSNKRIIAVTGATGAQGGSVVRFLLKDGGFQIRALTRNVDSDAAKGTSRRWMHAYI